MKRPLLIAAAMATLLATPAFAHVVLPMPGCAQENASININFHFDTSSFAESKQKFDAEMKQIDDYAKQQSIGNLTLQSMNYNVSSRGFYNGNIQDSGTFQLSGSANYRLDSADDAFKLADFLTKQHFIVSVNVNRYGNMACPLASPAQPAADAPRKE